MSAQPATRQEALAEALRWGAELSHWNEIASACGHESYGQAYALTVQADAAEVQRLLALWHMLPDGTEATR